MRITYDPEADVLLIRLGEEDPVRARDLWPDAVLHYDAENRLTEIEILSASKVCKPIAVEGATVEVLRPMTGQKRKAMP